MWKTKLFFYGKLFLVMYTTEILRTFKTCKRRQAALNIGKVLIYGTCFTRYGGGIILVVFFFKIKSLLGVLDLSVILDYDTQVTVE